MAEYIDRSVAIARITALEVTEPNATMEDVRRVIADIPAADAAPVRHGRWEWFDEDTGTPVTGYEREWGWRCAHCKEELPDDYDDPDYSPTLRFCPACGAKMNEVTK